MCENYSDCDCYKVEQEYLGIQNVWTNFGGFRSGSIPDLEFSSVSFLCEFLTPWCRMGVIGIESFSPRGRRWRIMRIRKRRRRRMRWGRCRRNRREEEDEEQGGRKRSRVVGEEGEEEECDGD